MGPLNNTKLQMERRIPLIITTYYLIFEQVHNGQIINAQYYWLRQLWNYETIC